MTLYDPAELTPEAMISLASKSYGSDLLITGVPTNADGEPVWSSLDDLIGHPHAHGLFSCLESIAHVHQWVSMTADEFRPALPCLIPRFVATIDEVIDGSANTWNPAAWIHLGHGELEHTLERIEGLEDWEDEEYELIPGISNGYENGDFRNASDLANRISNQQGDVLFLSLPLCYAKQIATHLCRTERIHLASASTDFQVTETLQFYDGASHGERMKQSLASWSMWVQAVERSWRGAAVHMMKKNKAKRLNSDV